MNFDKMSVFGFWLGSEFNVISTVVGSEAVYSRLFGSEFEIKQKLPPIKSSANLVLYYFKQDQNDNSDI